VDAAFVVLDHIPAPDQDFSGIVASLRREFGESPDDPDAGG
jgi:hypothetical protein